MFWETLARRTPTRNVLALLELCLCMGFSHGANRHEAILGPARRDAFMAAEHPVRVLEACVDHRNLPTLGLQRAPPAATGRPAYAPAELWQLSIDGSRSRLRSRRRLAQEPHRKVEVLGLGKQRRPDHQTRADCRQPNLVPLRQRCRSCAPPIW
jgi:transposase